LGHGTLSLIRYAYRVITLYSLQFARLRHAWYNIPKSLGTENALRNKTTDEVGSLLVSVLGLARFRPGSNRITRKTGFVLGVIDCFGVSLL